MKLPTIGLPRAVFYYTRIWLPVSLLTLPGGAIAFFSKKQNCLGAGILSIGNTIVALTGAGYVRQMLEAFPCHLLTVVSCAAILFATVFGIQKKPRLRLFSLALTALMSAAVVIWAMQTGRTL